jgi:hypothetical protein
LDKGGHEISVLYYNHASTGVTGKCDLKYKGPDTNGGNVLVPTSKLGSAPLRLAKLAKELNQNSNKTTTRKKNVISGTFVYDEDNHVGIMPKGSCDIMCQRGARKTGGAYFKFFCSTTTNVTMKAKVNVKAQQAFAWMDKAQAVLWPLGATKSLLQTQRNSEMETQEYSSAITDVADDPGPMRESAESPSWVVGPGEHTLIFQGRPGRNDFFALKDLRFETGASACKFFLEGKDKSVADC